MRVLTSVNTRIKLLPVTDHDGELGHKGTGPACTRELREVMVYKSLVATEFDQDTDDS